MELKLSGIVLGNGFNEWMGVQIAIFATVMVAGAVVAFKTRSVPSAFNESSHILFSLQILIFMLILLSPLDWALVNNSPEASIVIQCGAQLMLSLFLLASNFLPKIFFVEQGRGTHKYFLFSGKSTRSSQGVSNVSRAGSSFNASGVQDSKRITTSGHESNGASEATETVEPQESQEMVSTSKAKNAI